MLSYRKHFTIICSLCCFSLLFADTNEINYENLQTKDLAQEKMEDLYYINIKQTDKINLILTGENILDRDNFSNINRVKTYKTFKVQF
jgi:hypothetical protein